MFHVEHSGTAPPWQNVSRGTEFGDGVLDPIPVPRGTTYSAMNTPGVGFHPTNLALECRRTIFQNPKSRNLVCGANRSHYVGAVREIAEQRSTWNNSPSET